jgi:hypothetical protein
MTGLLEWLGGTLRGTLTGWQWLLLLAIPPLVVLLYFLKLRRQPLEVPSTYLWHRTIEDLHVNSFWQKLRQNLLLFLQLLLLLLAILACLRPSWQGSQLTKGRHIFLVDTSASMSATDVSPTRLEAAKQRLIEMIDQQVKPGNVAMVISFSDRAIVEQPFTDNRRLLKRRIAAIEPTQRPSDLDEAVRVAAGLANPGRSGTDTTDVAAAEALPADLVIFSDGRYRRIPQFTLGTLEPMYLPIGTPDAANVGIIAFSSGNSPDRPEKLQLFAQLQNFGPEDADLTANLVLYNPARRLVDAARVKIPAGGTSGVEFTIDAVDDSELRLELDHADALALDNVAFAAVNRRRRGRVLVVTPKNDALETVLQTTFSKKLADIQIQQPEYLQTDEYKKLAADGALDLVIYDQCRPEALPQSNTYFIAALPPDPRWSADPAQQLPQIIDADRVHPVMRYVELGDLKWIVEATPLKIPTGGTNLIDSHVGPLLAIAPREGFEDLIQGFALVATDAKGERFANSDWPIRVSFPVFIGNVLSYLGGSPIEANQAFTQPGQSVTLRTTAPVNEISITAPSGQTQRVTRGASNTFVYGQTERVGTYTVREAGRDEVAQRFTVNLFDPIESNIVPDTALKTEFEDIQQSGVVEAKRREGWKYLLIAALIVLLGEWYIYNRRVYI